MEEIWRVIDRLGRPVTLTSTALAHIQANHRDMAPWIGLLPVVVAEADRVARDPTFDHRHRHYKAVLGGRSRIRVVVHYRPTPEGWVGTVVTAHRMSREEPEAQIWP